MKTAVIVACLLMWGQGLALAGQTPPKAKAGMEVGIVKSVTIAQTGKGKGKEAEVVVNAREGTTVAFKVNGLTGLFDASAQRITIDKIAQKDKVIVSYVVDDKNVLEAKLIKIAR